jgi:RNA polymerase sigma factor (sigma-70 family)
MNLGQQEDHTLVALYRSGNESAFEVLIRRHQKRIFLQIYSANNTTLDYFRKESRKKEFRPSGEFTVFDAYGATDRSYEDELIAGQISEDLYKLIEFLPAEQRKVLELRMLCNYSFKEIAEETEVSINTALGRMRYAITNIQKLMVEHNISLDM